MKLTKRAFFGTGLAVGLFGIVGFLSVRYGGKVEVLETDPEAEQFFYRDGWIEKVS